MGDRAMTEKERFMARFDEKVQAEGLKDIKFLVLNGHTLTEEDFFSAANEFEDVAAKRKVEVNPAEMEKVEPTPSQLLD